MAGNFGDVGKGVAPVSNRNCPTCGNDGSQGYIFAVMNGRFGKLAKTLCQCSACFEVWEEYVNVETGIVSNVLVSDTPEWLQKERQHSRR